MIARQHRMLWGSLLCLLLSACHSRANVHLGVGLHFTVPLRSGLDSAEPTRKKRSRAEEQLVEEDKESDDL